MNEGILHVSISSAKYYESSKFAKFVSKRYFSKRSSFSKQNILVLKELVQNHLFIHLDSIHI